MCRSAEVTWRARVRAAAARAEARFVAAEVEATCEVDDVPPVKAAPPVKLAPPQEPEDEDELVEATGDVVPLDTDCRAEALRKVEPDDEPDETRVSVPARRWGLARSLGI